MTDLPNFPLNANLPLTKLSRQLGFSNFHALAAHVQALPYGRNANRQELGLVLEEGKGSCSSKHAFLKAVAIENDDSNLELVLGMYRMHRGNTPGIGNTIELAGLDFIPEAHCYLRHDNRRIDLTQTGSSFELIQADLLEETLISPEQVAEFKVRYHRNFIQLWVTEARPTWSLEKVWEVREMCIQRLSQNREEP